MAKPLTGLCVLFDLDGTLIDTAEDLGGAMNHALALAGWPPVALSGVRGLIGKGARCLLTRGFETVGAPPPGAAALDRHVEHFIDHYRDHIAEWSRPFPGMIDTLDALAADGASLAICTNKREALARALIDELGLAARFAAIIGGDTAGVAKPDPRPLFLCLEQTGARSGIFIGDSDTDILAAEAAGMPCLIADYGYGPLDHCAQAAAIFSSAQEIAPLVRTFAGTGGRAAQ